MSKQALWLALIAVLCVPVLALAQHGNAPDGYYPPNYSGDTFTGLVTATDDEGQTITLEYSKGKKTEDFTGRFDHACSIPTKDGKPMKPSDIPAGTDLTAYYNHKNTKIDGQKQAENVIIALTFNSFQGKVIPETSRKVYYCTTGETKFRAH
ncbi:MAG TPA: hypothetical protein VFB04_15310 [Terriglobales bacterium]|nr:hypothetical protein [Terriglobales bacterium]